MSNTQPSDAQITAAARALANHNADVCNVNREDNWMIYGDSFIESAKIALEAALAIGHASQAATFSEDELEEFRQTVEDFDDNGETTTPYDVLMMWAEQGLLDCDHFMVTDRGRALLGGEGVPHFVAQSAART